MDGVTQTQQAAHDGGAAYDKSPNDEGSDNRIQILDLHTENPIIAYQNQLFSCKWTSTIGTDLLLSAPDPDSDFPKLKEEQGFDVLAATGIKIVGQAAQLIPRQNDPADRSTEIPGQVSSSKTAKQRGQSERPTGPAHSELRPDSSKLRQSQAQFLDELIAAKTERGEKDTVNLHARKTIPVPGLKGKQREKASKQQNESSEVRDIQLVNAESNVTTTSMERARLDSAGSETPRRGTYPREYGPPNVDDNGTDTRDEHNITPDTTTELGHDTTAPHRDVPHHNGSMRGNMLIATPDQGTALSHEPTQADDSMEISVDKATQRDVVMEDAPAHQPQE